MSDYYKEELMSIVKDWDEEKLNRYINVLEDRIFHTREQIQLLNSLKRKKRKKIVDTGTRGGK